MKKVLLFMALACPPGFANAQNCTPDLTITEPGMYPGTDINLPYAYVGAPYSTSVQFKVITDTTVSGTYVTVTNITLDSVTGMPPGFSYNSNPANHIFPGGSNACASMFGNPTLSLIGTYPLVVHVTVHGIAFGFIPVTQASTVTGYKIKIFGPPTAYFSATPTVTCQGDPVIFDDNSSNHPTSWQWSFPGGTPSSSNLQFPPPVTYATSGNKDITLTVSSPAGSDVMTKNAYVTVNSGPSAVITPSGNITICSGASQVLSANTGTGLSYQWKKNGTDISGATTLTYSVTATGNYSVVVSAAGGCAKTSAATNVTVSNVTATITPSGTTSLCDGENVSLNANSGTGLTYQWKKNASNISGATNISYTASTAGTYRVIVTDLSGCSKTSSGLDVTVSSLPVITVSANGPLTFCQGQSVTLTTNSGTGYTYQWKKNNVSIAGATNVSYSANASGIYKVWVTNSSGCSKLSTVKTVTVNNLPAASVNASGPLTFCQGQSVTLTANTGTGLTYQWKKNNVSIAGATNFSLIPTVSAVYKVIVTNGNGCSKVSPEKTVTINSLPSATISANGSLTFCQGQNVTLTANSGSGLTYQWKKNNINITGATSVSFTATVSGIYRVIVSNASGCSKTSLEKTITVNAKPTASISASGPLTFCQGQSVTLTANSGTGLTYQWSKNNQNISGATNITLNPPVSGVYRVIVNNANGCSKTSSEKAVTINPNPTAAITANGPLTFCQGQSVTLTANSGGGLTYQWKKSNVSISGAISMSYTPTISGVYKVVVTNSNGCSKASAIKTVTVNSLPAATITEGGPLTFCQGQSVVLTANSGTGLTYQWRKYNVNIAGATHQSYTATSTGEYRSVVTNSNSCSRVSNKKSVVVNCREEQFDGINNDQTGISIYPNPTTSNTTIDLKLERSGTVSINVFDLTGKLILHLAERDFEEGSHQFTFDASPLADGIYFTRVQTKDKLTTIKLVVDKD